MHHRLAALALVFLTNFVFAPAARSADAQVPAFKEPPFVLPAPTELNRLKTAVIETNRGTIRFKLFPQEAPWHVANFKYRADKGLYKNVVFHIFHPDYIIQAGAAAPHPDASADYSLPAEFNQHQHLFGALGMARRADFANPERRSSGNQFHILLGDSSHMNGAFTVFGQAIEGLDVLEKLGLGDVVKNVTVYVTPD
ncbi:MAG: peptidylprolyl isomerase [Oligoflexia bacterium]|nr:peptidylprolyl isomerase [Oligoflexia bacterium]